MIEIFILFKKIQNFTKKIKIIYIHTYYFMYNLGLLQIMIIPIHYFLSNDNSNKLLFRKNNGNSYFYK